MGPVTLGGEEELDEEEREGEEEAEYGPTPGLAAAGLDLSGNGGCGGCEGAAGVKAEDGEGMVATGAGEARPAAPNGRAVLL